jgi:hypothetical protein
VITRCITPGQTRLLDTPILAVASDDHQRDASECRLICPAGSRALYGRPGGGAPSLTSGLGSQGGLSLAPVAFAAKLLVVATVDRGVLHYGGHLTWLSEGLVSNARTYSGISWIAL